MCSDISDKVRNVYSDVRDNTERVLEQISMVDQDVFLFDDTIRDNIRHARPNATDEEIEANCDSFIRKMEKGYDTPTGENGNLLSGGERQVMIAHTLSIVKNADQILVVGDGRIVEAGTHDELLAKGGKYAAMWNAEQKLSA